MLALLFYLGPERYAVEARRVVEVIPRVVLRPVPHAPAEVGGTFSFRGATVPVIDLCQLTRGEPSAPLLSSRIILIRLECALSAIGAPCDSEAGASAPSLASTDQASFTGLLGLLAEKVTEAVAIPQENIQASVVQPADAQYLGPMATDAKGSIQFLIPERVLPARLQAILYPREQQPTPA